MKSILQFCFAMIVCTAVHAQNAVTIQINHLLDGVQFENGVNTTNDLGNDFMIDRLEYYLSGFSLVHDGGQVTEIDDLYVLVSLLESTDATIIELGEFELENLEYIRFHLGVDEEANHADPSLLDPSHPLAPKFPSMHWGWAAGYRFIALEGMSGSSIDQELQFHCIGNEFYKQLEFPVSSASSDEGLVLTLDADYKNLLNTIDVSGGLILHGNLGDIKTLVNNMIDNVFVAASVTSTKDHLFDDALDIFPNPLSDGLLNVKVDVEDANSRVYVHNYLGQIIYDGASSATSQIELNNKGLYIVSLADASGKVMATRKVVVQ